MNTTALVTYSLYLKQSAATLVMIVFSSVVAETGYPAILPYIKEVLVLLHIF